MYKSFLAPSQGIIFSIITIGSYVLASVISAFTIIIISRSLGPSGFALFSTAIALSMLITQLNNFGLSIAIQKLIGKSITSQEKSNFLSVILQIKLIVSVVVTSLGIILTPFLNNIFHVTQTQLIPLTIIASLAPSFFEYSLTTLQSLNQFILASVNYVIPSLIKLLIAYLILKYNIIQLEVILLIYLLSTLPSIFISELFKGNGITYRLLKRYRKEEMVVFSLVKHSAVAVIATGLIDNIDLLISKHYLSNFDTGLLGGVSRISMLLTIVAVALSSVLNPRLAKYVHTKTQISYFKKTSILFLLLLASIIFVFPASPLLIKLTIGSEYLSATNVLNILIIAGIIQIMTVPFISFFFTTSGNKYFSISSSAQALIIILGNVLFLPMFGLEGTAYTKLFSRLFIFIFTLVWIYKIDNSPLKKLIQSFVKYRH